MTIKRKIKMVLLAMTLCLGIGLQSMGAVQAAVNYEACPHCATRVTRGQRTKIYYLERLRRCEEHEKCDIYRAEYVVVSTITCETPGCQNYNKDLDVVLNKWYDDNAHVTQ